jgi:hypothetical protein
LPRSRRNQDIALWFQCVAKGYRFSNLADPVLIFNVSRMFWKRRSLAGSLDELSAYMRGLHAMRAPPYRFAVPLVRFFLRLAPKEVSMAAYALRARWWS